MTGFLPRMIYGTPVRPNKKASIQSHFTSIEQLHYHPSILNASAFHSILPYQTIDSDLMLLNNQSIGFGLHILPVVELNQQLISSLLELIKHQLPKDVDCTIMLHKHPYVHNRLKHGLQPMLAQVDYVDFAEMQFATHLTTLHDTRCYLFLSTHRHSNDKDILLDCRNLIETIFTQAHITHARIVESDFLILIRSILTPDLYSTQWPALLDLENKSFNNQIIPSLNTWFILNNDSVDVEFRNALNISTKTRIINCQIKSQSKDDAMQQIKTLDLACPFLISFTVRGRNKAGTHSSFYNLMLFTTADNEKNHLNQAIQIYHALGFNLELARTTQWLCFLSSLPFFITEGYFHELYLLGLIKKIASKNIINLMPISADSKGSPQGLLLPSHKQQIAFLNTFDSQNYPINNFHYLIAAPCKNHIVELLSAKIMSGLALGEQIYLLDFDQSYKKLCNKIKGIYIDAAILKRFFVPLDMLHNHLSGNKISFVIKKLKKIEQLLFHSIYAISKNVSFIVIDMSLLKHAAHSSTVLSIVFTILQSFQKSILTQKKRCIIDCAPRSLINNNRHMK
ncbi:MAG: TraC family protein [Legionellaceae bacterium]|nr:TraC family protein [Legionellaceae bacterium]